MTNLDNNFQTKLIKDKNVNKNLDKHIRDLLVFCFPESADVFKKHRYYQEPPEYRWCVFNSKNDLIAHTSLHLKTIKTDAGDFRIGGIGEVCVASDYRGLGLLKMLIKKCDDFLKRERVPFALLFGKATYYSSSGYIPAKNKIRYLNTTTNNWIVEEVDSALYKQLGGTNWPEGIIDISCPIF
jgi:predicted N-acetyltransferase YhbS